MPIGEDIELNVGHDPRVILETTHLWSFRDRIFAQFQGVDVLQRIDGGEVRFDPRNKVVGWDEHQLLRQRLRNTTERAVDVEIRRSIDGDAVLIVDRELQRYDSRTLIDRSNVKPGESQDLMFEVVVKVGRNVQKTQLTLEQAAPAQVPWMKN